MSKYVRKNRNTMAAFIRSISRYIWVSREIIPPHTYKDRHGVEHRIAVPTASAPGLTFRHAQAVSA